MIRIVLRYFVVLGVAIVGSYGPTFAGSYNPSPSMDISQKDLSGVLDLAKLPKPWRIDQLAYMNRSHRWQVDLYYDPRQVGPRICVATLITLDLEKNGISYLIEDKLAAQKSVALESCDISKSESHFTSIDSDVTDEQLRAAVKTVFAARAATSDVPIQFESDDLRPLLSKVRGDRLHWIEKQSDGDIAVSFFVKALAPDVLAIKLSDGGRGSAYVYRENGPDITSKGEGEAR